MHSRIDPVKDEDAAFGLGGGIGGVLRRKAAVDRVRKERGADHVLLFDAGDFSVGTAWYTVWGGAESVTAMNALGYDAVTLGNHEMDNGTAALARVLKGGVWKVGGRERAMEALAASVVVSNLDVARDPGLRDRVLSHAVITRGGMRIGVVGAINEDVADMSNPGEGVKVLPVVESVQRQVDVLTADGVDVIVFLSHCGTKVDIANVAKISGIDVVVAGHDHALLGNADALRNAGLAPSSVARDKGPYPIRIKGKDGNDVVLVSAFEWGRLLGRIDVGFDREGHVVSADGAPMVLKDDGDADPALAKTLDALRAPVSAVANEVVAVVPHAITRAPKGQSDLGALLADAMLGATQSKGAVGALAEGDARGDVPEGRVTFSKLIEVWPFETEIMLADLSGDDLEKVLSRGLAMEPPLQLAGITARIVGRPEKNGEKTVRLAELRVGGKPVVPGARYTIAIDDYVARGNEGMTLLKEAKPRDSGHSLRDALVAELRAHPSAARDPQSRVVDAAP